MEFLFSRKHPFLSTFILILLLFSSSPISAQDLSVYDFKVDKIELLTPVDSLKAYLGDAYEIKDLEGFNEGYEAYYYENFTFYIDEDDQRVWAFEIMTSSVKTQRDVTVGDIRNTVDREYGEPGWDKQVFHRVGPHDVSFKDYTRQYTYEMYPQGWFMVFYFKDEKVKRILLYAGITE